MIVIFVIDLYAYSIVQVATSNKCLASSNIILINAPLGGDPAELAELEIPKRKWFVSFAGKCCSSGGFQVSIEGQNVHNLANSYLLLYLVIWSHRSRIDFAVLSMRSPVIGCQQTNRPCLN